MWPSDEQVATIVILDRLLMRSRSRASYQHHSDLDLGATVYCNYRIDPELDPSGLWGSRIMQFCFSSRIPGWPIAV